MKKPFVVSILALLALTLAACGGQATTVPQDAQPPSTVVQEQPTALVQEPTSPDASHAFDTQTSDAGRVVIDVTPMSLSGDVWEFEVALNTHSVNLNFDVAEVSGLRCDRGQEHTPVAWDGSAPGGHHRSGVLEFASLDHPTAFIEIAIRDVAKVSERVFRWDMPRTAETSPGESTTQATAPHPTPVTSDGPAQVALSDQEFYFGDVVMSEGVVSHAIDITNSGAGVLRIEGVEPT